MAVNEIIEISFTIPRNTTQSTWRLWWDAVQDNHASRNQTLLEVTCLNVSTDEESDVLEC